MRKGIVLLWLALLASCVGFLFWRNEWKYHLPTPVPVNYRDVARGSVISLPLTLANTRTPARKPILLHFFNPDCPCSRFNIPHFRELARQYARNANFAIVLMTDKNYSDDLVRKRFDIPDDVMVIRDSSLATRCGVYSTPQAVIIDSRDRLFYRGNYNRSRYCSDEKTSFARMALENLLHNVTVQNFSPLALQAYGCQLPSCTQ